MWEVIKKNPISTFAVLLVAAVGGFLVYMAVWQTTILASPGWCAKALGAEKLAPGQTYQQAMEALKSCNDLLLVQLNAIAVDSHIGHGTFAVVIIVLIVVVIAGARASFKMGKEGLEGSVGRDAVAAGAAAGAAAGEAAGAAAGAAVAATPTPTPAPEEPGGPRPGGAT